MLELEIAIPEPVQGLDFLVLDDDNALDLDATPGVEHRKVCVAPWF